MMKNLFLTFALLGSSAMLSAQATIKIPKVYQPVKKSMYHKGWIDFNKNGVMMFMKIRMQKLKTVLKTFSDK